MKFMIEILILVIGLCFGSFINMLVFRTKSPSPFDERGVFGRKIGV